MSADRDPAAPPRSAEGSRMILECTFESTSRTSPFEAPLTRWTRSRISKRTWQSTFRGKCRGTATQSLPTWMTQKGFCLRCIQKRLQIFFQPSVDIRTATAQVTSISQTVLKQMPPGTTPPQILNYNASTVPVLQPFGVFDVFGQLGSRDKSTPCLLNRYPSMSSTRNANSSPASSRCSTHAIKSSFAKTP